jgi:hypothetical protein
MHIRDFVATSRAGKGYYKIKDMVESAYGEKALKKTAICAIIKKVKPEKTLIISAT